MRTCLAYLALLVACWAALLGPLVLRVFLAFRISVLTLLLAAPILKPEIDVERRC